MALCLAVWIWTMPPHVECWSPRSVGSALRQLPDAHCTTSPPIHQTLQAAAVGSLLDLHVLLLPLSAAGPLSGSSHVAESARTVDLPRRDRVTYAVHTVKIQRGGSHRRSRAWWMSKASAVRVARRPSVILARVLSRASFKCRRIVCSPCQGASRPEPRAQCKTTQELQDPLPPPLLGHEPLCGRARSSRPATAHPSPPSSQPRGGVQLTAPPSPPSPRAAPSSSAAVMIVHLRRSCGLSE